MTDKMYWAARCKSCSGMVGYRDVRYALDAQGVNAEEKLAEGQPGGAATTAGQLAIFNLRQLRPTPVKFLIPRLS